MNCHKDHHYNIQVEGEVHRFYTFQSVYMGVFVDMSFF